MNIFAVSGRGYLLRMQTSLGFFITQVRRLPFRLGVMLLLLLAWFLAVWRLGASDFWLDEAISFWIADRPLGEVLRFTMGQSNEHPPLYYILLHFWIKVAGQSEFALRSLSGIGSLLAVALNASLARRWFGERVALLAALMLLSAPLWVLQIRDTRMYAWLTMLALLNVFTLDKALASSRGRDWLPFFLSLFLMLGTHYFSGLLLVGYGLYLLVFWRRLPEPGRRRLLLLLGGLGAIGGGWILSQPGPRGSLIYYATFALDSQRSWSRLVELLAHWSLGNVIFRWPNLTLWPLALCLWLLSLIGIATAQRPQHQKVSLPWLLALLIVLPILLAFLILPTTHPRHVMATFGLYTLSLALGIVHLNNRYRSLWSFGQFGALGSIVLTILLGLNFWLAFHQILPVENPFRLPANHIAERARSDEHVIYTYYFDWPLDHYYNHRRLPASRLTVTDRVITQEEANSSAESALAGQSSLWLVLYPGLENTNLLEEAFNRLAFPTSRVWFPGDRGVVHYFAPLPLQERTSSAVWENGIILKHWRTSGDALHAGDAFRFEFEWQSTQVIADDLLLVMSLFGPDQTLWARQLTSPCAGRCPTNGWADNQIADRMAFYVPTDVPPGDYELRIGWVSPGGAPISGRVSQQMIGQADLPLVHVNILPAEYPAEIAPAPPLPQRIDASVRAGLSLTSIDFANVSVYPGAVLPFPMQLRVSDSQPSLSVQLTLEGAKTQHILNTPLGPFWYPSEVWSTGQLVRVQPRFQIPGDLQSGQYRVSLNLIDSAGRVSGEPLPLGILRVDDRPRRFDIPDIGTAIEASCAEGIRLVRFALPQTARPGSQLPLTLLWQAGGPTSRNWKIFAHLTDADGKVWSQADGYPMLGQALTPSWQPTEVIVDVRSFHLPADLPAGAYQIRVGFYEEATDVRLPCASDDAIVLPVLLSVEAP